MLVYVIGYEFGDFVYIIGDVYIYLNYMEQVKFQFSWMFKVLLIVRIKCDVLLLFDFIYDDFEVLNYDFDFVIKVLVVV